MAPPATELGTWFSILFFSLGGVAAIVAILVGLKNLRKPAAGDESVTRSEIANLQNEVRLSLATCVTKAEFAKLEKAVEACATKVEFTTLRDSLKEFESYTHEQNHRTTDALNTVANRVAVLDKSQEFVTAGLKEVVKKLEISNDRLLEIISEKKRPTPDAEVKM